MTTWSCETPTAPSAPTWITSSATSIEIEWNPPTDDGGCPVVEYRVFRDAGDTNSPVATQVNVAQLSGINYINEITVTEFPSQSLGLRFRFKVIVITDFATDGVSSSVSNSFILADLPDKPSQAPTRNSNTNENIVAVDIIQVPGNNGSPIVSYNIEIDDGFGGSFVELQGYTLNSLSMTAYKITGVVSGQLYRLRYRALNEIGFGPYSDIAYILTATVPYNPTPVTTTIVGSNVVISWKMPFNGASLIY
jgi:hypothetical protein